jgi:hypothetical protein
MFIFVVNNNGDKLCTVINDSGDKLLPVRLVPAKNLSPGSRTQAM